ncbi:beta strand repeat-containing protein [Spirosoma arcticum]
MHGLLPTDTTPSGLFMKDLYRSFVPISGCLKRWWLFILLFLLGQVLYVPTAQASHFRYGNLTWRQLPTDPTNRTIEFKLTMSFRRTFFNPLPTVGSTITNATANGSDPFVFGDGTSITNFNFIVTSVNTADDFIVAEATLVRIYAANGNYNAYIESNARLSTLQNNANGRYRIPTTVNAGTTNLPPVTTLPPVINLPFGQSAATFTIPATDPNGDALTFSLATAADLGATATVIQPTGLSITPAGQVTFNTQTPRAVGQLYSVSVKISDGQSFVIVDFVIRIVAASAPPVFVYGGITPANNATIQTYVGCPVSFTVRATDTDPTSNTITLQGVGIPQGAVFSPVTGSNTVTSAFSLIPTTEGTSVVTFIAEDNIGNQAITNVTLRTLQPLLTATSQAVCVGSPVNLVATPGTSASGVTNYTFRGPSGLIGTTGTSNTATVSGLSAGVYSFSVTTSNSLNSNTACTSTAVTSVTVDAPPTVTLSSSGTLTCAVPSVTLTANSSTTGTGTSYAFRGPGLNQTGTSTTAVVTQSGTYTVVVTTASGCTALATTTVASNTTTPAAPTVSVTLQPSCTLATGTITVTAPTGADLTYSINGTTYTNTTGSFTGVAAGTYSVTVRNSISGCISPAVSVTVTPQPPTPVAPTALVTVQPTCLLATGTIVISAPLGAGLTYSINGVTYNTLPTFTGVTSGTYAVTVRNSSGCTSPATIVTVNPALAAPAAPTVSVTSQPSCTLATGTITVTAPTAGTGFNYSIDGATYTNTSGIFTGVAPGTYSVTVRNNVTNCVSPATSVTVTAQPPTPAAPTASVTSQPSCTLATGTITVTAPTGAGLTYSINGTTYTNTTGSFTGVAAGTYPVTVRNSSGCTSPATSVTVTAQPPTPAAPTVSVTSQPSCTLATGTITITAPTGAGLTYSIDGTTYTNTTGSFTGVAPGTYAVTVRNASGCTSPATSVTVTAQPPTPAAPTVSVTSQPSCTLATGTITITAPLGAGLTYSIDGTTYTNTTGSFTGVVAGTYAVTVRNASGCTSPATSVTVTAQPPTPAAPTASVTSQPSCTLATGTITVTAPTGAGLTYSINGTTYTNTTGGFTGVAAGTYPVTVRNSSGCTSPATSVTVTAQPPTPVLTVNSATTCAGLSTTLTVGGCTGGTLIWSTSANTTSIVVMPVVTTTYSATCTNTAGCSATIATTVTVRPTPTFTNPPTVTSATCVGATATSSGRIDFTTLQNTEQAGIVAGSSYAGGPAFGAVGNQVVTSGTVSFGNLPNPATRQPYTVRLFGASGTCFTDVTVILDRANCQCPAPSCVKVLVALAP